MCIANVEHISLTQLNFYKDLSDLSKKMSNKYVQTSQKMELLTLKNWNLKVPRIVIHSKLTMNNHRIAKVYHQGFVLYKHIAYFKWSSYFKWASLDVIGKWTKSSQSSKYVLFFKSFLKLLILIKPILLLNKEKKTNHLDVTI